MSAETLNQEPDSTEQMLPNHMLDVLESRLETLEANIDEYEGTKEFPDYWYEETVLAIDAEMREYFKSPDSPTEEMSEYFSIKQREADLQARVSGYEPSYDLSAFSYMVGEENVSRALAAEAGSGPMSEAVMRNLEKVATTNRGSIRDELQLLTAAYGLKKPTDLLSVEGDDFGNKLKSTLLSKNVLEGIMHIDNPFDSEASWAENQLNNQKWLAEALVAAVGMDSISALKYSFSASKKVDAEHSLKTIKNAEHFGLERLERITKFTGIEGIDAYTPEQLSRMERLATNPQEFAEAVQDHDVTVVMTNRSGDYSGVLNTTAEIHDDQASDRVLFFEINRMSDIYRHMSKLKKIGIRPSTIVLSAHANEGQFMVIDERDEAIRHREIASIAGEKMVALANEGYEEHQTAYSMHGMQGVARIVSDYMSPSRAIDEPESEKGRKKILFQSCNMGKETQQMDLDEKGEKVKIGTESVVSQLAKDLIKSGVEDIVDVYGGPETIQMHRTESGVRFSGAPEVGADGEFKRTGLHAVRATAENGHFSIKNVDEIVMRKSSR